MRKIISKKIEVLCIMYLKTLKTVFSASEQKYTAAGGDIQVPWGGIHERRKSEQRD